MYLLLLTLGFIAISALGLLARYKIRPSLCRLLAAGLALAGFIAFPILDEQITTVPPPPQFNFHEADENASGPATLLQIFAVDMKGFVTAQEIPLREAQTLEIPLGVYGSVDLWVDPVKRSAVMLQRKTRWLSSLQKFEYIRNRNSLPSNDMEKINIVLQERFFAAWNNYSIHPICETKNCNLRLSWRLIQPDKTLFRLEEKLALYDAGYLSQDDMKALNPHTNRQAAPFFLLLMTTPCIFIIIFSGFALFIALPTRLLFAMPTAALTSILFLLAIDNQNWRQARLIENDATAAWRVEQHSLFFSRGESELTWLGKILQSSSSHSRQVKP